MSTLTEQTDQIVAGQPVQVPAAAFTSITAVPSATTSSPSVPDLRQGSSQPPAPCNGRPPAAVHQSAEAGQQRAAGFVPTGYLPPSAPAYPPNILPPDLPQWPTLRTLPPIKSLGASLICDLQRPAELVRGLIHQGSKVMLGGGSKTMKSWILLHLAIAIHLGIDWLGFPTMKGKVLYLNFEISEFFMVERAKKICETLCVEYPEDMEFWHLRGFACSAELIIPVIIEKIRGEGYVLIIIDPTYKLMGDRDENAPGGVGDLLNQFERIAVETGAAVAFAAHYSKGNQASKEAIDRISGSGVFGRDPDTILPMTLHAEAHAFVIEPILRNFPPVAPFVLRWEYPLMQTDAELNPEHLKLPRMPRRQSKPTPTIEEFVGLFPKFAAATIEASTLDSQTIAKEFDDHLWKTGAIPELKKRACEEGHLKIKVLAHNRQLVGRPEIIAHFDAPQPQAQH